MTTFTNTNHEAILFHAGEGGDVADINHAQRLSERRMLDYLTAPLFGEPGVTLGSDQLRPVAAALSVKANDTDLDVEVQPGTVLWALATDPGSPDPRWIMHRMAAALTVSVTAADPTNPRWDILSAKLEYDAVDHTVGNVDSAVRHFADISGPSPVFTSQRFDKRRRTLLTIEYTAGTPAPSPTEPSAPAGHIVFARIKVPAAATALDHDDVVDKRKPAGFTRVLVPLSDGFGPGGWTRQVGSWANGGPTDALTFPIHPRQYHAVAGATDQARHLRLAKLFTRCNLPSGFTATLRRHDYGDDTTVPSVHAYTTDITAGVGGRYATTISEIGELGAVWANGYSNPHNALSGTANIDPGLQAQFTTPGGSSEVNGLVAEYWGF